MVPLKTRPTQKPRALCFRRLVSSAAQAPAAYAVPASIVFSVTGVRPPPPACLWVVRFAAIFFFNFASSGSATRFLAIAPCLPFDKLPHCQLVDEKLQSSGELCALSTGDEISPVLDARKYQKRLQGVQTGRPEGRTSEEAKRTRRYVEPLSDARTPLADCFNALLVETQRRDRSAGRMRHREHRKSPAIPPCNPEVAEEISSRRGHPR